jgi:hypothetical protein
LCGQNNVAASAGSQISQNCAGGVCEQNNFGRRRRQIVEDILALTEDTLKIAKRQAEDCVCFNPLAGSLQQFAGEAAHVCPSVGWCFVKCDSSCRYVGKVSSPIMQRFIVLFSAMLRSYRGSSRGSASLSWRVQMSEMREDWLK